MSAIENQETVIQAVNSLHPTTLFHFTKNEEAFYSILTELYFKPFLARERIVGVKGRRNFAVPMVSFCDIKLSQIKDHSGKYGEFGFGLTKEWAEKNDLHPVGNDSNLLIVFYVQIMPDDFVMQLHRF